MTAEGLTHLEKIFDSPSVVGATPLKTNTRPPTPWPVSRTRNGRGKAD